MKVTPITTLDWPDATFDMVVVDNTGGGFSDVASDGRSAALDAVRRVLRPGGRVEIIERVPGGGLFGGAPPMPADYVNGGGAEGMPAGGRLQAGAHPRGEGRVSFRGRPERLIAGALRAQVRVLRTLQGRAATRTRRGAAERPPSLRPSEAMGALLAGAAREPYCRSALNSSLNVPCGCARCRISGP